MPGSSRTRISRLGDRLKVCVAAPPEQGRANRAVVEALEEYFGAAVEIVAGAASPNKTVAISLTGAEVRAKLPP